MDTVRLFWIGFVVVALLIVVVARCPRSWLEVVVGALTSIWITMSIEGARKPDLKLELYQPDDPTQDQWRAAGCSGSVRQLRLLNRPLPDCLRWLQRSPAINASGTITFHPLGSDGDATKPMPIWWSYTPQLTQIIIEQTKMGPPTQKIIANPERLVATQQIPPGVSTMESSLSQLRFHNETDCYGCYERKLLY